MQDADNQVMVTSTQDSLRVSVTGYGVRTGMHLLMVLAVTLCFLVMPALAHAPSNITMSYNPDLHKLFVTVTHPTDDPATHYVRGVQVKLNGDVISDPLYKSQPGKNSFTYSYDVMANYGDTIWVVATDTNGQSLEARYDIPRPVSETAPLQTLPPSTVTSPPAPATALPATRTTYAAAGLLPVAGAAAVVLIRRK
jgi:hypothetical protein